MKLGVTESGYLCILSHMSLGLIHARALFMVEIISQFFFKVSLFPKLLHNTLRCRAHHVNPGVASEVAVILQIILAKHNVAPSFDDSLW